MKKVLVLAVCILSLNAIGQDVKPYHKPDSVSPSSKPLNSYCAEMKDGMIVLSSDGKVLKNDVVLSNGTRITKDGVVQTPDGLSTRMNEGECVDLNSGKAVAPRKKKVVDGQSNNVK